VVVVIPTYNERGNIHPLVERIDRVRRRVRSLDLEVLFVDDSSPDRTGTVIKEVSKSLGYVHLLTRASKEGIGKAYLEGFEFALQHFSPSVVVQMDGDLQHPPELIPELVNRVLNGADVVVASRNVSGGGKLGWSRDRVLVSWGANSLARAILGLQQKDVTSGFKAYSREMVEELTSRKLHSSSFSYQEETLLIAKATNRKVEEVPFTFVARQTGRSKLMSRDILRFVKSVIEMRVRPPN